MALLLELLQPCVYVLPALIQHLQMGACSVLMLHLLLAFWCGYSA